MTENPPEVRMLFRNTAYRWVWSLGNLYYLAFWFEIIVANWIVLELTDSPFHVGLVGFFRMGPMLVFGLLLGTIADRMQRINLLLMVQIAGLVAASSLAFIAWVHHLEPWMIYAATGLIGCGWAADFSARRALIGELLDRPLITRAMSMEALSLFGGKIFATLLAGLVLASTGVAASYLALGLIYAIGTILAIAMRSTVTPALGERPEAPNRPGLLSAIRAGWSSSMTAPVIRAVLIITAIMNLLVLPYQQLIALIADEILEVGAWEMGLLASGDGIGGIAAAMMLVFGRASFRDGLLFVGASTVGCFLLVGLATSHIYGLSLLLQLGIGACFGTFSALQAALILNVAKPAVRARALGMLATAIGVTPFGMLLIGGLSSAVGVSLALSLVALLAAALVVIVGIVTPELRSVVRAPGLIKPLPERIV